MTYEDQQHPGLDAWRLMWAVDDRYAFQAGPDYPLGLRKVCRRVGPKYLIIKSF